MTKVYEFVALVLICMYKVYLNFHVGVSKQSLFTWAGSSSQIITFTSQGLYFILNKTQHNIYT